ncbi:Proclotting enzyme, partial [Gryllus bimaculatus]
DWRSTEAKVKKIQLNKNTCRQQENRTKQVNEFPPLDPSRNTCSPRVIPHVSSHIFPFGAFVNPDGPAVTQEGGRGGRNRARGSGGESVTPPSRRRRRLRTPSGIREKPPVRRAGPTWRFLATTPAPDATSLPATLQEKERRALGGTGAFGSDLQSTIRGASIPSRARRIRAENARSRRNAPATGSGSVAEGVASRIRAFFQRSSAVPRRVSSRRGPVALASALPCTAPAPAPAAAAAAAAATLLSRCSALLVPRSPPHFAAHTTTNGGRLSISPIHTLLRYSRPAARCRRRLPLLLVALVLLLAEVTPADARRKRQVVFPDDDGVRARAAWRVPPPEAAPPPRFRLRPARPRPRPRAGSTFGRARPGASARPARHAAWAPGPARRSTDPSGTGRLLSLDAISETLGAINTVGRYLVNMTRYDRHDVGDELPHAIYTISKNVLGTNVTEAIAPIVRGALPAVAGAGGASVSARACTTPRGEPGECDDLSYCPQLLLDLPTLRQSICFKSLFVPGVCCPVGGDGRPTSTTSSSATTSAYTTPRPITLRPVTTRRPTIVTASPSTTTRRPTVLVPVTSAPSAQRPPAPARPPPSSLPVDEEGEYS